MSDYDFKTLNDKEFEILCADLLGDALNIRFERFKSGRDGGVDARHFRSDLQEIILQCKHRPRTPIEQLIRHLHTTERPKVERLKPARYLLAVSHALSRADKSAIQEALSPHIRSPSDIYGQEDLNDLLGRRPAIETRHYKLWLSSAAVLEHLLNRAIFERSAFSIDETLDAARKYVRTSNHDRALEMLEALRVVILTGEAGIGKTTLAEHLCLHYVTAGFQLLKVAEDISEAESVFERDASQAFYFDDFLGRNYLEALSGHEGNHIAQFIRRVSRDGRKRFILTSRNTILNQGKLLIDTFQHHHLEKNEFELNVSSLTALDKARILYSHIWHSGLAPEHIEEFYKGRRYRSVVHHENFNPRLISVITDCERLGQCPAESYWSDIVQTLENPADVWENPFVAQQDDFGRCLVVLVTLNGRPMRQDDLAEAYARYISWPQNHAMSGRRDFLLNLRHLTGSLLSRHLASDRPGQNPMIDLFNPSIGDFVLRRSAGDIPSLKMAFLSLRSESSLGTLNALQSNKFISDKSYLEILRSMLKEAHDCAFSGLAANYVARILIRVVRDGELSPEAHRGAIAALTFCLNERIPVEFEHLARAVRWGQQIGEVDDDRVTRFIREACAEAGPTQTELSILVDLHSGMDLQHPEHRAVGELLKEGAIEYLRESIHHEIDDSDVFGDVDYGDEYSARKNLESLVSDWFGNIGIACSSSEVDDVIDAYDIGERQIRYHENADESYEHHGAPPRAVSSDEIDDLFDRS